MKTARSQKRWNMLKRSISTPMTSSNMAATSKSLRRTSLMTLEDYQTPEAATSGRKQKRRIVERNEDAAKPEVPERWEKGSAVQK